MKAATSVSPPKRGRSGYCWNNTNKVANECVSRVGRKESYFKSWLVRFLLFSSGIYISYWLPSRFIDLERSVLHLTATHVNKQYIREPYDQSWYVGYTPRTQDICCLVDYILDHGI